MKRFDPDGSTRAESKPAGQELDQTSLTSFPSLSSGYQMRRATSSRPDARRAPLFTGSDIDSTQGRGNKYEYRVLGFQFSVFSFLLKEWMFLFGVGRAVSHRF